MRRVWRGQGGHNAPQRVAGGVARWGVPLEAALARQGASTVLRVPRLDLWTIVELIP